MTHLWAHLMIWRVRNLVLLEIHKPVHTKRQWIQRCGKQGGVEGSQSVASQIKLTDMSPLRDSIVDFGDVEMDEPKSAEKVANCLLVPVRQIKTFEFCCFIAPRQRAYQYNDENCRMRPQNLKFQSIELMDCCGVSLTYAFLNQNRRVIYIIDICQVTCK